MENKGKLLIIDDSEVDRARTHHFLDGKYELHEASSGKDGLEKVQSMNFSCVLLEQRLPDMEGLDLIPQLVQREIPAVMLTGHGTELIAVKAMKRGGQDYLSKEGLTKDSLLQAIFHAVTKVEAGSVIRQQQELLKQHTRELEATNHEFRLLAANVPARFCYVDAEQRYRYVNERIEELFEVPKEELLGKHTADVLGPETYEILKEHIDKALSGQRVSFEAILTFPKKGRRHIRATYVPRVGEEDEQVVGYYSVVADVTDLKQAEQRLVQSERLAAIGEAMTGLAHESRNILARIQASARMIARRVTGDDDLLKLLNRIEKAQDDLHRLFEEVGRYAAPVKLSCAPSHLGQLLEETWENLAPLRVGRNAQLEETSNNMDLRCVVDSFSVQQVFRNILENAIAACEDPIKIQVTYSEARINNKEALRVAIRDNGPGLTPQQEQKIFDAFYTTRTHGTGLGLAIAKRIVDAHGGEITVGTGANRGAEFQATFPRRPA